MDGFKWTDTTEGQRVEGQAPSSSEAEESPTTREFIERGNRRRRLCRMSCVGVGDPGSNLEATSGLGDGRHRDIEVAGGEAFVVNPAAIEAQTLGFYCEVTDGAYGRLGDQIDAGFESPFRHGRNLLRNPEQPDGELVDWGLWFPLGKFCN
jgi:hypothetical protein